MKINTSNQLFCIAFLTFLAACSTKKDTFLARNSHALSTKYNILYNGQIGLDKGIESLKINNKDNFWKRLPIERIQLVEDLSKADTTKNPDFKLAETKATKAIQKHSMNIDGREKNSQIDEAYLLLGKSRYYDQRYIPALDAFNYILYKYPNSSNINEAKIWREKTNIRLGNDALALKNITRFLKDQQPKKQAYADANAILAEAFLNLEEKDSAASKLKKAIDFTKIDEEKARYRFIIGQLYQEIGKKDSALYFYQSVIDMNRKSERKYVIQAYAKKAQLFDYETGDSNLFEKTYDKLIADRENRPFLDVIYHNMGVYYDKKQDQKTAKLFYNESLKANSKDAYLEGSNYRNLGNLSFRNKEYQTAAKYYDSTLVKIEPKTREYIHIEKIRKNLVDVIKYETLASRNDSILTIVSMNLNDKISYFEKHIEKLKTVEEAKSVELEKQKIILANIEKNTSNATPDIATSSALGIGKKKSSLAPPSITDAGGKGKVSDFYFYNPTTVAYGKVAFKKEWGDRKLTGNWRAPLTKINTSVIDSTSTSKAELEINLAEEKTKEKYTSDFYLNQLPTSKIQIDSITNECNFAYYQLGIIYKERFKEYDLASNKLEELLLQNPEEKLVIPAMYNLYKIYQLTDSKKAEQVKSRISSQYPNSRYAQIINNIDTKDTSLMDTPEKEYIKVYKLYQDENFSTVLTQSDAMINQFSGDEIVPKFELLKANTIGKLKGLTAYKNAMQEVADTYPNSEEGKNAQEILLTQIPTLEQLDFTTVDTKNWKILYKVSTKEGKDAKNLVEKIKLFMASENTVKISYSFDVYSEKENFIVIQGIKSEIAAVDIAQVLKENKKYLILEPSIVISNENYKIIQIKKNLEIYLSRKQL